MSFLPMALFAISGFQAGIYAYWLTSNPTLLFKQQLFDYCCCNSILDSIVFCPFYLLQCVQFITIFFVWLSAGFECSLQVNAVNVILGLT